MAVEVNVTCDGYSGSSATFVTQVRVVVDGETAATFDGAQTQAFSGALDIEGAATVQVFDRTEGNDYDRDNGTTDHGGPGDSLHGTYVLDCPVKENLHSQPHNPSSEPEAFITLPVPVLVVEPSVNPSVSPNTPVDTSPTTSVALSTVAPQTYSGQDDFYVATFVAEPVGCCADYVAEVGTAPMLPATGVPYLPQMLGVGSALVLLGVTMLWNAKKRPSRSRGASVA